MFEFYKQMFRSNDDVTHNYNDTTVKAKATSTATTAAADRWPTCFSASASAAAETPGKPGEIIYLNISSILV